MEGESVPQFRHQGASADFVQITNPNGLASTRGMSGWSNGIADFDNDGWKDLITARGNVIDNIAQMSLRTYEEPNMVFRNLGGGKFVDVSVQAGDIQGAAAHRGLALGDLDNDGRIDAVVTVLNGPAKCFPQCVAQRESLDPVATHRGEEQPQRPGGAAAPHRRRRDAAVQTRPLRAPGMPA